MGLDISHDAFSGGYSRFMYWRIELSHRIGIFLEIMEGFYSEERHNIFTLLDIQYRDDPDNLNISSIKRFKKILPLKWEDMKPSPLHELLYHSDCEGKINYSVCRKIVPKLEEILDEEKETDTEFYQVTQQFITGCKLAIKSKEPLKFG